MTFRVLTFAILALGLAACTSRSQQAAAYNDRVIDQQFRIIHAVEGLDTLLVSRDAALMDDALVLVKSEVIRANRLLDSLGAFQKDSTLLMGARSLFGSYDHLSQGAYADMVSLLKVDAPLDTAQHITKIYELQAQIHADRQAAYETFYTAQQAFGKKFALNFEEDAASE